MKTVTKLSILSTILLTACAQQQHAVSPVSHPLSSELKVKGEEKTNWPIDFDILIEIVEAYGMPQAPAKAKLILAHAGSSSLIGNTSNSHDPAYYEVAFLLEKISKREARNLVGWEEKISTKRADHCPAIRPFSLDSPEPKLEGYLLKTGGGNNLITAIELARRGDEEGARNLWQLVSPEHYFYPPFYEIDQLAEKYDLAELVLARELWSYFELQLYDRKFEIEPTYQKLVKLRNDYQVLFSGSYSTRITELLADLKTALIAEKPKPGSVEALLIELGDRPGNIQRLNFYSDDHPDSHRAAEKIMEQGVSALPELQALTGDTRFVRKSNTSVNFKHPNPRPRLGDLAAVLIKEITGSQDAGVAARVDSPEAERAFFKLAATTGSLKIKEFHEIPLRILAAKYPQTLVGIANKVPQRMAKETYLRPLLSAVTAANLPKKERSQILFDLASRMKKMQSGSALQVLAKFDSDNCVKLLKPVLAKIPKDVNKPYWTCEEANFTRVVMEIPDIEIWKQYLQVARRSSIGLRMEMMNSMNYIYIGGKNKNLRVAFLAAFLEDREIRDKTVKPKRYEGPCAAFTFDQIEVRNFVAMQLSSLLKLEPDSEPNEFWGAKKWATYRKNVNEALAKMELPDLAD